MDGDVGLVAEPMFEKMLNGGGTVVSLRQGDGAVHTHVEFNGDMVADAAGAEVMRLMNVGDRLDDLENLVFGFFG